MDSPNEAEFQAHITSTIRKAFPLLPLNIKLEHYLNLTLGHHNVIIDGKKAENNVVKGRYDILIKHNDEPLMIVELKAPDVSISQDDIKQALSYGRLLMPKMAPLAAVTNGTTSILRRVYDNTDVSEEDCLGENLNETISAAAKQAAQDVEKAVRNLLGTAPKIWNAIFSEWNNEAFELLSGKIGDLRYPLCKNFSIPRQITETLINKTKKHSAPIVVHGEPLSGITNILAQYCNSVVSRPVLFVNSGTTCDIFRFIANKLTTCFKYQITKEDVLSWFYTLPESSFLTLVLDDISDTHLNDLLGLVEAKKVNLIIGCNTTVFNSLKTVPGRIQNTLFGTIAEDIPVTYLSNFELNEALKIIDENYHALFYNGIIHSIYYRNPRNLRLQLSRISQSTITNENMRIKLYPLVSPRDLLFHGRKISSNLELENDYLKLAEAYLKSVECFDNIQTQKTAFFKRFVVLPDIAERELTTPRLDRLKSSGILDWIKIKNSAPAYIAKSDELLAYAIGKKWASYIQNYNSQDTLYKEIKLLLDISEKIPYGPLILAFSILLAAEFNKDLLSYVIPYLINDKPIESELSGGSEIEILVEKCPIRMKLPEEFKDKCRGNIQSWLVLSYLAEIPIVDDNNEKSFTVNAAIFIQLGAYKDILCPVDLEPVEYHSHNLFGDHEFVCHDYGIIEPIQQSMLIHAMSFPNEFTALADYAKGKNNVHLGWRLLGVAREIKSCTDDTICNAGIRVEKILKDIWRIEKTDCNEKCPCSSGNKV